MPETLTNHYGPSRGLKAWSPQNVQDDLVTQGGLEKNDLAIFEPTDGICGHYDGRYKNDQFSMFWAHNNHLTVSAKNYHPRLIDAFAKVLGYKPFVKFTESDGMIRTVWDKKDPEGTYEGLEKDEKKGEIKLTRLLERGYRPSKIMKLVKEKIENKFKDEPSDVHLKYHSIPFPGGGSVYIDFTAEYLIVKHYEEPHSIIVGNHMGHYEEPSFNSWRCEYRWGIRKSFSSLEIRKSFMKEVIESPDDLLKKLFGRVYFFFSKEVMDRRYISIESDIDPDGVFRRVSVDDQIHTFSKKRPDLIGQPLDNIIEGILTDNFFTIK